jgi:hypothetical protein
MSEYPLTTAQAHIFDLHVLPSRDQVIDAFKLDDEYALFHARLGVRQYEVLNQEFVHGLAAYLVERAQVIRANTDAPITVLEVGAGTGKLSYFLGQTLEQQAGQEVKLITTDSGKSKIPTDHTVERMDHVESLRHYQPGIVIASWMPNRVDWTQDMRDTPSVMEYILIGEAMYGCCGDDWETWGSPIDRIEKLEDQIEEATAKEKAELKREIDELETAPVPSEHDGFVITHLEDLSALQTPVLGLQSTTVSFQRGSPLSDEVDTSFFV